jgi:hypothetical protein
MGRDGKQKPLIPFFCVLQRPQPQSRHKNRLGNSRARKLFPLAIPVLAAGFVKKNCLQVFFLLLIVILPVRRRETRDSVYVFLFHFCLLAPFFPVLFEDYQRRGSDRMLARFIASLNDTIWVQQTFAFSSRSVLSFSHLKHTHAFTLQTVVVHRHDIENSHAKRSGDP